MVHTSTLTGSAPSLENVAASVHSLPNELLVHIFQLGLNTFSSDFDHDLTRCRFLLTVTAVCARWRDVGISSPSLWSSIGITFTLSTRSSMMLRRMKVLLDRSRDVSLDLDMSASGGWDSSGVMKKVLAVLVPHWQRCRSIRLTLPGDDLRILELLFPLPGRMGRLVDTTIHMLPLREGTLPPRDASALQIFLPGNISSIANLSLLGNFDPLPFIHAGHMCPSTLSTLSVDFTVRVHRPLDLFIDHATTLVSLKLCFSNIPDRPPAPIHLPRVRILQTTGPCLTVIHQVIHCPALEELILHRDREHVPLSRLTLPTADTTQTLLTWSNLRVLDMCDTISFDYILAILAATPTITTLVLPHSRFRRRHAYMNTRISLPSLLTRDLSLIPDLQLLRIIPLECRSPNIRLGLDRDIQRLSRKIHVQSLASVWIARPLLHVHYLGAKLDLGGLSAKTWEKLAQGRFTVV